MGHIFATIDGGANWKAIHGLEYLLSRRALTVPTEKDELGITHNLPDYSLLDILMSLASLKVLQMLAALWNIEKVDRDDEGDNMGSFRTKVIHFASFFAAVVTVANTASATSGPGCLHVVNVESWDVLNIRASASANSEIVDELEPSRHGIISLDGECGPVSRPWASRWCPVTHYNGDRTTRGYVKARYVRDAECP